jgi:hypothetical protein
MAFRDDSEAARARTLALEFEVKAAHAELESLRPERERANELEAKLKKTNDELAEARGQVPRMKRLVRLATLCAVLATLIATIGAVAYGIDVYDTAQHARAIDLEAHETPPPILVPPGAQRGHVVASMGTLAPAIGTECWVKLGENPRLEAGMSMAGMNGSGRVQCGDVTAFQGVLRCSPLEPPFAECTREGPPTVLIANHRAVVQHGPLFPWSIEVQLDE